MTDSNPCYYHICVLRLIPGSSTKKTSAMGLNRQDLVHHLESPERSFSSGSFFSCEPSDNSASTSRIDGRDGECKCIV